MRGPNIRFYAEECCSQVVQAVLLIETICSDLSSEQSRRNGSGEGLQHRFLCRTNKNYPKLSSNTPSYLELCQIAKNVASIMFTR